jgi:hypothetical protein
MSGGELGVGDQAEVFLFAKHVREEFEHAVNGTLARLLDEVEGHIGGPVPEVALVLAEALRDGADRLEARYPQT